MGRCRGDTGEIYLELALLVVDGGAEHLVRVRARARVRGRVRVRARVRVRVRC